MSEEREEFYCKELIKNYMFSGVVISLIATPLIITALNYILYFISLGSIFTVCKGEDILNVSMNVITSYLSTFVATILVFWIVRAYCLMKYLKHNKTGVGISKVKLRVYKKISGISYVELLYEVIGMYM